MKTFNSSHQMLQSLNTEEKCREYLEELRWHGEPVCPHCGSISKYHYKLTQNGEFKGLYKCKDCRKRFTVTIEKIMKAKLFCMVLFASIFFSCEKGDVESELPEKPPVEKPNEPEEPSKIPSTNNIFNYNNEFMIIGTTDWASIAYGNGRYVVVGYGGYMTSSTDGIVWESPKITPRSDYNWISVTFGNGKFVAIDSYPTCNVITSTDGINWTLVGKVLPNNDNRQYNVIKFCNGKFIAAGESQISISTNVTTWSRTWLNSYVYSPFDVAYGNGKYVVGIQGGHVLTSSDATGWTDKQHQCLMGGYWIYGIAFGNGMFVMVGSKGMTARSTDGGNNWEIPSNFVSKKTWNGVIYNNGKFIAVSADGYIITSVNGLDWTTPEQIKDESGNVVTANLNGICAMP